MAAIVSGEDNKIENEFYEFGINFGNIFQISDDLIDIFSTSSGKDRFRDLKEGKITLPFILLQNATEKEDVNKYFSFEHSEKLLDLFDRYDIKKKSQEKVDEYYRKCQKFIERFPPSPYKKSLTKILDFIRFREY